MTEQKQAIECVSCVPPSCPACGCTDRTEKECVVKKDINGTTRDGHAYSVVQWNYTNCRGCGQRYRFMEYLLPAIRTTDTVKVRKRSGMPSTKRHAKQTTRAKR